MAFNYSRQTESDSVIEMADRARAHVDCLLRFCVSLIPLAFLYASLSRTLSVDSHDIISPGVSLFCHK